MLFSREWFERYQLPMLLLANTSGGRKLLRIHDDVPRGKWIVNIQPHCYTWSVDNLWKLGGKLRRGEPLNLTTDFRTHAKFSKRLYYEALPKWRAWGDYVNAVWRPFGVQPAFADTLTAYPNPNPETNSVDGWTAHYILTGASWATIQGGAGTDAGDSDNLGRVVIGSDTTTNEWQYIYRFICLFLTSTIGASSTINSGTLSLDSYSTNTDGLSILPNINVYSSSPASNTALAAGDYDSLGSTAFSTAIAWGSWGLAYNNFTLNAAGLSNISKTDVSKFGARNANYDVANIEPTWSSFQQSNFNITSAEATGTSTDPKLVVNYTTGGGATGYLNLLTMGVG